MQSIPKPNKLEVNFSSVPESLQWLVLQFETIRYLDSEILLSDKFIPRPDAALVFQFKKLPKIILPFEVKLKPFFVAPVISRPNQLQMEGGLDSFIIICKASVLSRIFHLQMQENKDLIIDLPTSIFGPLWKKLNELNADTERISCFSLFMDNLVLHPYNPDYIDFIYHDIVHNIRDFHFEEIPDRYGQSISNIQRTFIKRVGVSMKKLMRISRINQVFNLMIKNPEFNAGELMFQGNYYDQAHFIKDFKELTGETPKQFFHHSSDLCRIISGMFNT